MEQYTAEYLSELKRLIKESDQQSTPLAVREADLQKKVDRLLGKITDGEA